MKTTITQPFPPYDSTIWEIKKNEPDGWTKAWQVTKNGEHVSYFCFYDDAAYYVTREVERSLVRG